LLNGLGQNRASSTPKGNQVKNKTAGLLLAAMIAVGGFGITACSSDDSNSGSSVSEQTQQAQDTIDSATQQGKEAVDDASKAVDEAKGAVDSVQGSN